MKFTILVAAIMGIASLVLADSERFGFLVIRSGSPLQYATLYAQNSKLYFGSSSSPSLTAVITDDGKLHISEGKYAVQSSDGSLVEGSESDAALGFYIKNGYLGFRGKGGFTAVFTGNKYEVSTGEPSSDDDLGVSVRPTSSSGSAVDDYLPTGGSVTTFASATSSLPSSSQSSDEGVTEPTTTYSATLFLDVQTSERKLEESTTTHSASLLPITQISDGQVQAPTTTYSASLLPITQISDGQVQAPTTTYSASLLPITQISDGQVQAPTTTYSASLLPITHISDGQVQAPTTTTLAPSMTLF
ncbi:LADA_0G10770g1_1 [Lachancea dasiensis]|uniref:LADA_0G10770g1_1 n=1 Tax=Lachancea dasiensis TaxID=1072105 RepID=A0A1G4JUU4_9SACH|nr:LADA_0G10770g1_1 [Lachancea dasiensis]